MNGKRNIHKRSLNLYTIYDFFKIVVTHNFVFQTTNLRHAACNMLFTQFETKYVRHKNDVMISNENANGDDNDHDGDENNKMNVKII